MILLRLILFILLFSIYQCRKPDKVYCGNKECTEPISKAKTLLMYNSADSDLISFKGNSEAIIYMKSAGTNPDLWFAVINDLSGYVNSQFLRESKVFHKNPSHIITLPVEEQPHVQPEKVQQAHEVVEGTTIYTTEPTLHIVQGSTENPEHNHIDTPALNNINNHVENQVIDSNVSPDIVSTDAIQLSEPDSNENVNIVLANPVESLETEPTEKSSTPQLHETSSQLPIIAETIDNINNNYPSDNIEDKIPVLEYPTDSIPKLLVTEQPLVLIENEQSTSEQAVTIESVELKTDIPPIIVQPQDILTSSSGNSISLPEASLPEKMDFLNVNLNPQPNDNTDGNTSSAEQVINTDNKETIAATDTSSEVLDKINDNGNSNNVPDSAINYSPDNIERNSVYYDNGASEHSKDQSTKSSEHNENLINQTPDPDNGVNIASETDKLVQIEDINNKSNEIDNSYEITTPLPVVSVENVEIEPISNTVEENKDTTSTEYTKIFENEPSEKNGFLSNLYTTVADIWPTTVPPYIKELPTVPVIEHIETPYYDDLNTEQSESTSDESLSLYASMLSAYYAIFGSSERTRSLFVSPGENLYANEYCEDGGKDPNRLVVFMLTTALSVLLFTLGYYYIDKKRQDGRLVGMINSLQRDLLCSTKECEILKEEFTTTKHKLEGIEDNSFGMDDMVQSLKEDINEYKAQNERLRNSLDNNEKLLRVSENTAGELQNSLSEMENTLSELLAERAHFEEQIANLNGKIEAFEEELISVSRERDSFQLKYVSAELSLDEANKLTKNLEELSVKLADAKNTLELQKHEIITLKDCIKDLKSGNSSNIDVTSLIDHSEMKAKLNKALEEKSAFEQKYAVEHMERVRLQEDLQTTQDSFRATSQQATEHKTRLEVLGKYFQEREGELLKELSAKEAVWLSKQGESASTVEKIEALQQEVQRYKEKCDSLTLELAEQESSRRTAVAELESRAHAAWLEARAARRDAAADREGAAVLRRKLASMSTQPEGAPSPHQRVGSPLDTSARDGVGLGMGVVPPPLPPLPFLPPLLPPLPRPPPLGRLPSPHPPRYSDRRYSPDSRYSPESRYSPVSRYSPETVRYSPDSRYSPERSRRPAYSPRPRRRLSRERYHDGRGSRQRNGPALPDTETEYASDSPTRSPRRRRRYSGHSGPSSGSGCSSETDK